MQKKGPFPTLDFSELAFRCIYGPQRTMLRLYTYLHFPPFTFFFV